MSVSMSYSEGTQVAVEAPAPVSEPAAAVVESPEAGAGIPAPETAEAEASEPTPEPAETLPDEPKEKSSRLAAKLLKAEQVHARKLQELKALEASITEKQKALEAWETGKASAKRDPLAFLEKELGVTYQQLTESILSGNQEEKTPVNHELAELKAKVAELESIRQEAVKAQESRNEQVIQDYRNSVVKFAADNASTYERINLRDDGKSLLLRTVDEYAYQNNKILQPKEAADMVESFLDAQFLKEMKAKKIAKPETQTSTQEDRHGEAPTRTLIKTTTPRISTKKTEATISNSITRSAKSSYRLNDAERQARLDTKLSELGFK
jgi:hypothetical protein